MLPKARIKAACGDQFTVAAGFDDAPLVDHHQAVHAGDGGETVGECYSANQKIKALSSCQLRLCTMTMRTVF